MSSHPPAHPQRRRRKRGELSAKLGRWSVVVLATGAMLSLDIVLPSLSGQNASVEELGLFGTGYVHPSGLSSTAVQVFNPAGYVGGFNVRFSGSGVDLGRDAWLADTNTGLSMQVGLTGSEFENTLAGNPLGYRFSEVSFLSASGFAAGTSSTFDDNDTATTGKAAWVANAATGQTLRVGLFSNGGGDQSDFISSTGFEMSMVGGITVQGETWGTSQTFSSTDATAGQAAWVANSLGQTQRVGLFGNGYFQPVTAFESTTLKIVTSGGWAVGTSARYAANNNLPAGQDAWIQNVRSPGSSAVAIGLGINDTVATEFSRTISGSPTLSRTNLVAVVSDGGYVGGSTARYNPANGNQGRGQAAWIHTIGGSTLRVGFLIDEPLPSNIKYTSGGFQHSEVVGISANGIGIGSSQFYIPGAPVGKAAFAINVPTNTTIQIGLKTGIFLSSDGRHENLPAFVSSSGWVLGTATRYNGASANGKGAWVASASTGATFQIGLADASVTNIETSTPTKLTESGYVAGSTEGPIGGSIFGKAAWVARASDHSTARVGLFGAANIPVLGAANTIYQSQSGVQLSSVQFLTESGYAAGFSTRYLPADTSAYDPQSAIGSAGATSWVYHAPSGTFAPIILSIRVQNNYSYTRINALYETGLALGTYELYDTGGALIGDRAFAWMPGGVAYDLGINIGATLGIEGWASLNSALYADIYGRIIGYGTRLTNSINGDSVYILATIPEPSAALLGLIGAGLCGLSRRRRAA